MKRAKKRLVLAKDTIGPLDSKGLGALAGGRPACTGPATTRTANDCSGDTYTGETFFCTQQTDSGACGASLYCTFIQP